MFLDSTALRDYKIMCKDGSINTLEQIPDIHECSLYSIVDSEVVARYGDRSIACMFSVVFLHLIQMLEQIKNCKYVYKFT